MAVARFMLKWGANMTTITRHGPQLVGATIGRMFPLLWSVWPAVLFSSLGMTEKRRFRRKWPLNAENSIDARSMTQLSMGRVHNRHYLHLSQSSRWNVIYIREREGEIESERICDYYKLKMQNAFVIVAHVFYYIEFF